MPVITFSTFWVPTRFMPGWYQAIAIRDPFNPILTAGRAALLGTGTGTGSNLIIGSTAMAALAGLTYTLATRRYTGIAKADRGCTAPRRQTQHPQPVTAGAATSSVRDGQKT